MPKGKGYPAKKKKDGSSMKQKQKASKPANRTNRGVKRTNGTRRK